MEKKKIIAVAAIVLVLTAGVEKLWNKTFGQI